MLRVIREVAPRWIVGENVAGLISWNGGMVFDEVQADLEAEGYEVTAVVIPAAAVNAPHGRDRVWFVAYPHSNGQHERNSLDEINTGEGGQYAQCDTNESNGDGDVANSDNTRQQTFNAQKSIMGEKNRSEALSGNSFKSLCAGLRWDSFPSVSPICIGNDGIPDRLDGITISKWRKESIKAAGNAVVPQVVYEIFKAIEKYENKFC